MCALSDAGGVRRIGIEVTPEYASSVAAGDSVAVNGVCLTRTDISASSVLEFDVVQETLDRSNLGLLAVGDLVNVERALRFGARLGGHIVAGHIWNTVTCLAVEEDEGNRLLWCSLARNSVPYVLHKGFVALDGVSLTVAKLESGDEHSKFAVTLIPETRQRTRLGSVSPGDQVNLEVDGQVQAIVETVERVLAQKDATFLGAHGRGVEA